jgi:hypothetical protein
MVTQALIFEEYCFWVGLEGTDHLEAIQGGIDDLFGKGVAHVHNKKGGVIMIMFIGELSIVKKAHVLLQVEEKCHLIFKEQREAKYQLSYIQNLKWMYGDKLVIK